MDVIFQPVISIRTGAVLGNEGLGVSASEYNSKTTEAYPGESADESEIAAISATLRAFAQQAPRGKLFLSIALKTLGQEGFLDHSIQEMLQALRLLPAQIVVEVAENPTVAEMTSMRATVRQARALGFEFALDDFGKTYASLRLWSALEPEYVKIDQHFVHEVSHDPGKFQFVRIIRRLSEAMGTKVIGQGIENKNDLHVLRDLGIEFAQGPLIAQGSREALWRVAPNVLRLIEDDAQPSSPEPQPARATHVRIGSLALPTVPVDAATPLSLIHARFVADDALEAIAVMHDHKVVGCVHRATIAACANGADWLTQRESAVACMVDRTTLSVDGQMTLQDVSILLAQSERDRFSSAFLITDNGQYRGIGHAQRVMRELTRFYTLAMRHAHALTALPGNGPFQEKIQSLLEQRAAFVACSCELDRLEAYTEAHGYARADNLVKYTAILLDAYCDEEQDFLAHPGGGDFRMLMRSTDWNERCHSIVKQFETGRDAFLGLNDIAQGGLVTRGRRGEEKTHALPTLSIAIVPVAPSAQISHHHVSAALVAAHREAKKLPQGGIFVERRQVTPRPHH